MKIRHYWHQHEHAESRRGFRGGERRRGQRIFRHGDIQYVILSLLSEKPSHGYELIKAIEDRLNGTCTPDPELIYPTLTMLEEMGYVTSEISAEGKKLYVSTPEGKTFVETNKSVVDRIAGYMNQAANGHIHGRFGAHHQQHHGQHRRYSSQGPTAESFKEKSGPKQQTVTSEVCCGDCEECQNETCVKTGLPRRTK